jgi:Ner family transcriptional regulator
MSKSVSVLAKSKKPVVTDWHPADIVAALWKRGTSLQKLAREHNPPYHQRALTLALRRPWPKAERLIAEAIGATPQTIWPSRHNADGTPKSGRGERGLGRYKAKHSTGDHAVNVCTRRAA